jgi:probable F420-dependent oxidoreductase
MEVWHVMGLRVSLRDVPDVARRVERMGYDGIAIPDIIHDGLMAAALAVQATTRLRVSTSALIAFPRSPMTVAVAAWDLQESSEGRFVLGLGPQVRGNIVSRYSTPWTPPAPRMREYVQSLRAIFECWQTQSPLEFIGDHYRFTRMQPFTSPRPIAHPDIPIHLAAIGANMTALAGELADSLTTHPTGASQRFIREFTLPHMARGGSRSGESERPATGLMINPLCATGASVAEVLREREVHRQMIATLFSTPQYWASLDVHGWREVGERANQLVREGRWADLTSLVGDEILDTYVPAAPYADLAALLLDRFRGFGTAITLPLPENPAHDKEVEGVIARLQGAR